jgi:uncharacterized oxidoreductase
MWVGQHYLGFVFFPVRSFAKEAFVTFLPIVPIAIGIVAFSPNHKMATYGASKAALHSYTLSLRIALAKNTGIKVFELMPPLVNTDFSKEIGGANGIAPAVVAEALVSAFEKDQYEIHVGRTAYIYELSRSSPAEALLAMNSSN